MNKISEITECLSGEGGWLVLVDLLVGTLGKSYDKGRLANQIARIAHEDGAPSLVARAVGEALDQELSFVEPAEIRKAAKTSVVLCWSQDSTAFLLTGVTLRGRFSIIEVGPANTRVERVIKQAEFVARYQNGVCFKQGIPLDVWDQADAQTVPKRWFWGALPPLLKNLKYLILAAFAGNILAVAVSLFALQVWDRVIPAQSLNSLTVLAIGVTAAIAFELILRLQRANLIDEAGQVVDMSISSTVFGHMLRLKADARPPSLGVMAAQVREINQIREAISSTMVNAAIDLPFIAIYVTIIFLIGGPLVYPIIAVIPIVILIGLVSQYPLSKLATDGLEEASLRNGLIVESVLKADEIKLNEAETTMLLRWERTVDYANAIQLKQRWWRNFLMNATQSLQQMGYVGVVAFGATLVIAGDVTMGQVIACSILANRSIAPLTQVSSVMGALQGSVVAKRGVDSLMAREADNLGKNALRRELHRPALQVKAVKYKYASNDNAALLLAKLNISYGEKVGVIGRIGSGKSTLLRLLSGLADPTEGSVLLDNTEMSTIHPSDIRRAIGYQSQGAALFRGTIRDNLVIARPAATDADLIAACEVTGVLALIRGNPQGLDLMINEAGEGLSGGQKQSLLLARVILRQPRLLLLDEPTASMDDSTEEIFTRSLQNWVGPRTLIIATHRMRPLAICDRLIAVNDGRIMLDGPKKEVLAKLKAGQGASDDQKF